MLLFDEQLFITLLQIVFPNWKSLLSRQILNEFCIANREMMLNYFTIKKNEVFKNISSIYKQIFKTLNQIMQSKLEVFYYSIKNLNSLMF